MNNEEEIIKGEAYLDMLKDKARETDMLAKENLELRKEIERLNNILNKAIDKLNNMKDTYYESNMANDMQNIFDLLDILKGGKDNE